MPAPGLLSEEQIMAALTRAYRPPPLVLDATFADNSDVTAIEREAHCKTLPGIPKADADEVFDAARRMLAGAGSPALLPAGRIFRHELAGTTPPVSAWCRYAPD